MTDETLFYIFYGLPREQVQEAAAQDLYSRGWRFHKELKLWLTKDVYHDGTGVLKGNGFERGVYVFFDPTTWSRVKKEWVLYYDQLEERVLVQGGQGSSDASSSPSSTTDAATASTTTTTTTGAKTSSSAAAAGIAITSTLSSPSLTAGSNTVIIPNHHQQQMQQAAAAAAASTGGSGGSNMWGGF